MTMNEKIQKSIEIQKRTLKNLEGMQIDSSRTIELTKGIIRRLEQKLEK